MNSELESVIRRDPGRRGLASYRDAAGRTLLAGHLESAARDLLEHGGRVLIVTGFAIRANDGVRAETDGPPGAIYLAAMLRAAGIAVAIATDGVGAPVVLAGLIAAGLPTNLLIEFPQASNDAVTRGEIV